MRYPWVNIALFIVLIVLLLTGFLGLMSGAERSRWVLWLHGAVADALILMLFWKGRVILDVLRRKPRLSVERLAFLLLTVLAVALVATGLLWTTSGPASIAGFSLMTVHAVLGLVLFFLFAWHTIARRYIVRVPAARNRRAFFQLAGLVVAGGVLWGAGRSAKTALALPASFRRFTGSYETGSFTGQFPVVSWLFDFPAPLRADSWQLVVEGAVREPVTLTYAELLALPSETIEATLDCTGGWYSTQEWRGVNVGTLLAMSGPADGAASFSVEAVSGYNRRFPLSQAGAFILATHLDGQVLDHGHGYPVRLVAPDRRGYDWVKWVTRLQVHRSSHLLQPPLPLQ